MLKMLGWFIQWKWNPSMVRKFIPILLSDMFLLFELMPFWSLSLYGVSWWCQRLDRWGSVVEGPKEKDKLWDVTVSPPLPLLPLYVRKGKPSKFQKSQLQKIPLMSYKQFIYAYRLILYLNDTLCILIPLYSTF